MKENGGVIQKKNQSGEENDEMALLTKGTGDAIPREPEKLKLKGHRARITKVIFHPTWT